MHKYLLPLMTKATVHTLVTVFITPSSTIAILTQRIDFAILHTLVSSFSTSVFADNRRNKTFRAILATHEDQRQPSAASEVHTLPLVHTVFASIRPPHQPVSNIANIAWRRPTSIAEIVLIHTPRVIRSQRLENRLLIVCAAILLEVVLEVLRSCHDHTGDLVLWRKATLASGCDDT